MSTLSLIPLSLLLLFFSTLPLAEPNLTLIHKTCNSSALQDPNISFTFCLNSLLAAKHSRSADLRRLGLISIRLVRRNATATRRHIRKLLRRRRSLDPFVKSCLDDCFELYSDAIPTLKQARRDYRRRRLADVNSEISSVMDGFSTCEEGFAEREGVVSPLTARNRNGFELSAIVLSIINMLI